MKQFRVSCSKCHFVEYYDVWDDANAAANAHGHADLTHIPVFEAVEV